MDPQTPLDLKSGFSGFSIGSKEHLEKQDVEFLSVLRTHKSLAAAADSSPHLGGILPRNAEINLPIILCEILTLCLSGIGCLYIEAFIDKFILAVSGRRMFEIAPLCTHGWC